MRRLIAAAALLSRRPRVAPVPLGPMCSDRSRWSRRGASAGVRPAGRIRARRRGLGQRRYVVFDGSIGGVSGVWRRDLDSGALEQVAGGDAEMPSISADGQEISFTTNEGASLPAITHDQPDSTLSRKRSTSTCATWRCAARRRRAAAQRARVGGANGSAQPLAYGARTRRPGRRRRRALGDQRRRQRGGVRHDRRLRSRLLSRSSNSKNCLPAKRPSPTPRLSGCRARPRKRSDDACQPLPVRLRRSRRGGRRTGRDRPGSGRCLHRAGSSSRTSLPAGMAGSLDQCGRIDRRLDGAGYPRAGADAERRRSGAGLHRAAVAAHRARLGNGHRAGDGWRRPDQPAVHRLRRERVADHPLALDPCQGPFVGPNGGRTHRGLAGSRGAGDFIPRLSEHGNEVAFLSEARLLAEGGDFGGNTKASQATSSSRTCGRASRVQALMPVTEVGPPKSRRRRADPRLRNLRRRRTGGVHHRAHELLARPARVRERPGAQPGMPELFDADLRDGTLTRVTHGYAGGPANSLTTPTPRKKTPMGRKSSALARSRHRSPPRGRARLHLDRRQPGLRGRQHAPARILLGGTPTEATSSSWNPSSSNGCPRRSTFPGAHDGYRACVEAGRDRALALQRQRAPLRRGAGRGDAGGRAGRRRRCRIRSTARRARHVAASRARRRPRRGGARQSHRTPPAPQSRMPPPANW